VRLKIWVAVLASTVLLPAGARAAAPLTADFTATDISATNHQWYASGTTTTTAVIAQHGSVTFNYPTGDPATTRHNAFFGTNPPTSCDPALSAAGGVPTAGPLRAPWTATCRFDAPGTYSFVCQIHPNMTGTVVVSSADAGGAVGGSVPDILSLGVGESANLGRFLLGVAADYTATLPAVVTSTMANASLTVNDPSQTAPGHLLNGTYVMAQPLQIRASNAATPDTSFAPVTSPITLLTWHGPVTNDAVTVAFKQRIGATDPLRSGSYAKTLVFTLSSATP